MKGDFKMCSLTWSTGEMLVESSGLPQELNTSLYVLLADALSGDVSQF